jgi:N-acetyl-anhydromuramyl-L-alanine amidase AmpD
MAVPMGMGTAPAPISFEDRTAGLRDNSFTPGRGGIKPRFVVLHDTVGTAQNPDSNWAAGINFQQRCEGTIRYLQTAGAASIHWLLGPEFVPGGPRIYKLCHEWDTAWHAAGTPTRNIWQGPPPENWRAVADGKSPSITNRASIGIERWGLANETVPTAQQAVMIALVCDISFRHNFRYPDTEIVSHKWLQRDRGDGEALLNACRQAVKEMWAAYDAGTTNGEIKVGQFTLRGEIRQAYEARGGLVTYGFPLSQEFIFNIKGVKRTCQIFQRGILVFYPENTGDWRVQGQLLGSDWLNANKQTLPPDALIPSP